jgi:DNA modification methylase
MGIELYNKDCIDLLNSVPSESINLVLIDPPYEISRDTGFKNTTLKKYETVSMDFGEWDKNFKGLEKVIIESYRVLVNGGTLICFYDLWKISELKKYFINANFKQLRFIEYLKTNPVPLNSKLNYLTNAREIAITGVKKGKPTFNSEYDNGVYEYPICRDKGRFHPTQKPLDLISDLILKHSNPNDLVCDCFSGSGTTAVACSNLNRRFIGCEIDKTFYELSIKRLNEYQSQSRLI